MRAELNAKIEWHRKKMPGFAKAPLEVQQERQAVLDALEKRAVELEEELVFIELCIASVALRDQVDAPTVIPAAADTDDALVSEG
jgi:DNA sulfur modification protein DndD